MFNILSLSLSGDKVELFLTDSSTTGFLASWGEGFDVGRRGNSRQELTHLELSVPGSLSLCIMSGCGCLHLFPSAAGRCFSGDD